MKTYKYFFYSLGELYLVKTKKEAREFLKANSYIMTMKDIKPISQLEEYNNKANRVYVLENGKFVWRLSVE